MCANYVCSDGFKTNSYEKFVIHLQREEERRVFDRYPRIRDELAEKYASQIMELALIEEESETEE